MSNQNASKGKQSIKLKKVVFLGVFQNNKTEVNGLDKNVFEQKEVMKVKKIELKRNDEKLQDISREVSYISCEINYKRRKILHQKSVTKSRLITINCRS